MSMLCVLSLFGGNCALVHVIRVMHSVLLVYITRFSSMLGIKWCRRYRCATSRSYMCNVPSSSTRNRPIMYLCCVYFYTQILLVFHKDDTQSDAFKMAADEKCGYDVHVARSPERARSLYSEHHHDMVVIDCRHNSSKPFDSEHLCK